jgi:LAO/AO transport system kinase
VTLSDPERELISRVLAGEIRAGARLMRLVDDRHPRATELLRALHAASGRAHVIGVTGNPGSGKSTLTSALIAAYRAVGKKVGVIAVDPSSPFSGGAILGDRIRMQQHAIDPAVFIRSVATRGHLGGLSRTTIDLVTVLDAMGYDPIFVETVGVGQDEIEVIDVAHTTVVVLAPGLGDEIQAIKAGILENADVFVVNKCDREGADRAERELKSMQALAQADSPEIPVLRTIATTGAGVDALAALLRGLAATVGPGADARAAERARKRARHVLEGIARDRFATAFEQALARAGGDAFLDRVALRKSDPWTEAERLLAEVLRGET